ncbi:type I-E CRISPR-associated protein Cse1/CasA [Streptomyces sp. ADI93-02]|uniref:type I-E CRISPR-associated protein Cse1/CasA n=1 Tax=Streptomyces sp. ADI93-02 TaxID=1522757 RepID=UPI000F558C19|nr:type I-E CRISPR-associated protein Cse1/CasA [Streptomyces sp. ADI93-02]RPK33124.1 CRISPR-associated protein CasA/Cse1 [Streptomyces sp. ADI93-02]
MTHSFSLIDAPWLSLLPRKGRQAELRSLRHALLDGHLVGDVMVELETQKPALFRQVLLPVVLDALGRPRDEREWLDWFREGKWTHDQRGRLDEYLDAHSALFDLFHPEQPFAQVADLRTAKKETKPVGLIVATVPTGNNVPLFASRTEGDDFSLSPAQAAHWLLHTQCWDTAAIKTGAVGDARAKDGKTTGNPTGPLGQRGVTLPIGTTLFETLMLNLPVGPPPGPTDLPQWRRRGAGRARSVDGAEWQERHPEGLLDLWTWQSRRVRLHPAVTDQGVRVTRVVVAAGDRMQDTRGLDPHTMWRLGPDEQKEGVEAPPRRPVRLQAGIAPWRGLNVLLAADPPTTRNQTMRFATSNVLDQLARLAPRMDNAYPLRLELCGLVYGNQSAVIEDVVFDVLALPLASLDVDSDVRVAVLEVADQAEQIANAVNHLSADLRRALGAEPIPWDRGFRPGDVLVHDLDPLVRRFLAGMRSVGRREQIEAGQLAWEQMAWHRSWHVADRMLRSMPATAFVGRKMSPCEGKPERTYHTSLAEASFIKRRSEILHREHACRQADARRALRA